jgi:hypothetical protein
VSEIHSKNEPTPSLDAGNNREKRQLYEPPTIATLTVGIRTHGKASTNTREITFAGPS